MAVKSKMKTWRLEENRVFQEQWTENCFVENKVGIICMICKQSVFQKNTTWDDIWSTFRFQSGILDSSENRFVEIPTEYLKKC